MIGRGEFPAPVKLGARAVGWRRSDIEAWLESRPAAWSPNRRQFRSRPNEIFSRALTAANRDISLNCTW